MTIWNSCISASADLDVAMISTTEQWAQFSVAGPKARELVNSVLDQPIDNESFPFMACGEVTIHGVKGRLFRISFSGEHAYEIAIPSRYGEALYRDLVARAETLGGGAYGMEALNVLRLEKGFITHSEIHGRVTADDVGMGRMVSAKKDCIGKTASQRPGLSGEHREQLVGLKPKDPEQALLAGGAPVPRGRCRDSGQRPGLHHLGRVVADDGDPYRPRLPAERTRADRGDGAHGRPSARQGPRSARSATRSSSIPREDAPVANLIARTPFDGHLPLIHGTVEAVEVDVGTITSVAPFAGQADAVSKALEKAVGCALPPVGAFSSRAGRRGSRGAGWTSGSSWDPGRSRSRARRSPTRATPGPRSGSRAPDRGTC
jgi:hypothetical protein